MKNMLENQIRTVGMGEMYLWPIGGGPGPSGAFWKGFRRGGRCRRLPSLMSRWRFFYWPRKKS